MINNVNTLFMTDAQRRASLFRAMHTQPFTYLSMLEPLAGGAKQNEYKSKVDVNKDFFFTEIQGNFDEAFQTTNTLWDLSVYTTLENGSVYNYLQTIKLPSGLIAQEARNANVIFANQLFDDRQFEYCPHRIKAGDTLITQILNQSAKAEAFDVILALKGYYTYPNKYLSTTATQGVNESLSREIRFETWQHDITHTGQKVYHFKNDRYARMILGFSIVDTNREGNLSPEATIDIYDTFRQLKWSNEPMPIQFLAPRVGMDAAGVRDCHIYYLPIEAFWEPHSALQMEILNDLNDSTKWQLIMHTRTV